MPLYAIILLLIGILTIGVLVAYIIKWSKDYYKPDASHTKISDRDLLELIAKEKDGLLNVERVMKLTKLTKAEAKKRFAILRQKGLVKVSTSGGGMRYYYSLMQPLSEGPYPSLSSDPFLTLGDLMALFKHFDYRLSIQDICLATNLPVAVITTEMKHFIKENIVEKLFQMMPDGMNSKTFYILKGEYRNDPEKYLEMEEEINLDLSKLYSRHKQSR